MKIIINVKVCDVVVQDVDFLTDIVDVNFLGSSFSKFMCAIFHCPNHICYQYITHKASRSS